MQYRQAEGTWICGGNAFTTARELSRRVMRVSTGTASSEAGNDALIGEPFSSTILLCDMLTDQPTLRLSSPILAFLCIILTPDVYTHF